MSVLDPPTYDVWSLAKVLSTSAAQAVVDPDVACIPVHVTKRGAALLLALAPESVNYRSLYDDRTRDPFVVV